MSERHDKLHGLDLLPEGKKIGDVCPAFSKVEKEIHLGERSKVCASCRKAFNAVRKARKEIRLYAVDLSIPVAWAYPICGACAAEYRRDAESQAGVLASVESFHLGERPAQ